MLQLREKSSSRCFFGSLEVISFCNTSIAWTMIAFMKEVSSNWYLFWHLGNCHEITAVYNRHPSMLTALFVCTIEAEAKARTEPRNHHFSSSAPKSQIPEVPIFSSTHLASNSSEPQSAHRYSDGSVPWVLPPAWQSSVDAFVPYAEALLAYNLAQQRMGQLKRIIMFRSWGISSSNWNVG